MKDSSKLALSHAEGLQNTISERLLPGLAAAMEAIKGVQVTADVLVGVKNLRAEAHRLSTLSAELDTLGDVIESAHKDGSAHVVIANLGYLQNVLTGLEHSAQALTRHGPQIHGAIVAAVRAEADLAVPPKAPPA